jgi:hypothetical protein
MLATIADDRVGSNGKFCAYDQERHRYPKRKEKFTEESPPVGEWASIAQIAFTCAAPAR